MRPKAMRIRLVIGGNFQGLDDECWDSIAKLELGLTEALAVGVAGQESRDAFDFGLKHRVEATLLIRSASVCCSTARWTLTGLNRDTIAPPRKCPRLFAPFLILLRYLRWLCCGKLWDD